VSGTGACPESRIHPRLKQEKDKRECPKCNSRNVKTELEMVRETCPRCNRGVIEEIFTGEIS
jgi:ribosomal protein S27AE